MEAGFSIGKTDQSIQLSDRQTETGNGNISLLLMDIPVLYNFHFSPSASSGGKYDRFIVGVGAFVSVVLDREIETAGMIQSGKLSNWAIGPYTRLSCYPFNINGVQPGLYLDMYRSFAPGYFYDQALFKQNGIAGQLGTIASIRKRFFFISVTTCFTFYDTITGRPPELGTKKGIPNITT